MTRLLAAALAATVVLVPAAGAAAARPAAAAAAPTRFTVTVTGSGPDVILIPGLSSPREVWAGTAAALAGRYRLHLVQIAGFGGTPPGPNAAGGILDGTLAELRRYIAEQHLGKPAIVGHSMGGLLALMLAERAPDAVGKVMVVDALPFIGALFDPAATADSIRPQAERLRAMMAAPATAEQRRAGAERIAAGLARTAQARALVARWVVESDPAVSAEAAYEDMLTDARPGLRNLHVPVTVLFAWDAPMLPLERARTLYAGAYAGTPKLHLEPVEGSGHFIMLDRPDAFQAALRSFLKGGVGAAPHDFPTPPRL
jgi:pimeloyl-ACP methyl ester carboxylesterase